MIWLIGCKGMLGSEVARQLDEKKLIGLVQIKKLI